MHGLSRRSRYVSGDGGQPRLQRGEGRSRLDRDRVTGVKSSARAGRTRRVRYVLSVFCADTVGAEDRSERTQTYASEDHRLQRSAGRPARSLARKSA